MFGLDLQKNAAILAVGVSIGVASSTLLSGAVHSIWNATPFSAESKLEKARDKIGDLTGQVFVLNSAVAARDTAISDRDKLLAQTSKSNAVDYGEAATRWGQQCTTAFQSGVVAGRAAAKGSSNATPQAPGAAAPAVQPGGLQPSFRSSWASGAYSPAAPSPSGLPGGR